MTDEKFRHECEVRWCIRWSLENGKQALRDFLDAVGKKRGKPAMEKLKTDIADQWSKGNRGRDKTWL